jgi:transcriptional regulator with XRE-family HTH domain
MPKKRKRGRPPGAEKPRLHRQALKLRRQGLSLSEVGDRLGVSKQRIFSLLRHDGYREVPPKKLFCQKCRTLVLEADPRGLQSYKSAWCVRCATPPDTPFGVRLRALRFAKRLNQRELARQAGICPETIRSYENKWKNPAWEVVLALVRILGPELLAAGPPRCVPDVEPGSMIVRCANCAAIVYEGISRTWMGQGVVCLTCLKQMPDAPFGIRLKAFRFSKGLGQGELAKLSGVSLGAIHGYERAQHAQPRWENLLKLVRVFGPELVSHAGNDQVRGV